MVKVDCIDWVLESKLMFGWIKYLNIGELEYGVVNKSVVGMIFVYGVLVYIFFVKLVVELLNNYGGLIGGYGGGYDRSDSVYGGFVGVGLYGGGFGGGSSIECYKCK